MTNPAYVLAEEFANRALEITGKRGRGKVVLFFILAVLEGIGRAHLFDEAPFARVYVLRRGVISISAVGREERQSLHAIGVVYMGFGASWPGRGSMAFAG